MGVVDSLSPGDQRLAPHADTLDRFIGLARARRSVRRYSTEPVAGALIDRIVQAALSAPSAHNRQPWRFAVLTEQARKEQLARAMGERLRADRVRDGDAIELIEADCARSFTRISGAPVIIVVCLTMQHMDRYRDARRAAAEQTMAVQSTAIAAQNVLLAAQAAGLAACWMCAPLFCPDTVVAALELAVDWQPQALVTLGYRAAEPKPYSRKSASELIRYLDRDRRI